jgi:hypothetical protein
MGFRAMVFGVALATSEVVRLLLHGSRRIAVIRVLRQIDLPPYFYLKIDEKVFAVRLKD